MFLVALISASGCAPGRSIPSLTEVPPDKLLDNVIAAQSRIEDIKSSALLSVHFNGRGGRVSARIRYKKPGLLKVFVQGGFRVIAVIALNEDRAQVYIPTDNLVFEGSLEGTDSLIPGLLVPMKDIRSSLTGLIDLTEFTIGKISNYEIRDGMYSLSIQNAAGKRTIWVDPDRMTIVRDQTEEGDGKITDRRYEQYTRMNNIWRPLRIRILKDSPDESLDLRFEQQSLNSGLTASELALTLPESIRRIPLSEMVIQ
ncbi:MAG: DUF4292 domain-containing protein [Candidatus Latescibacteria bacterium]|nr:DUF4292 domain-containing protein [Candidatus Latescibacterota bacterium]